MIKSNKLMQFKSKFVMFLCILMCLAPMFLVFGCAKTPLLTDEDRTKLVIENTSSKIDQIDDEIMQSW